MTQETIKALSDIELAQVVEWSQQEQDLRLAKRRQATIVKIRELARSIEVGIKIDGIRGRPPAKNKKILKSQG